MTADSLALLRKKGDVTSHQLRVGSRMVLSKLCTVLPCDTMLGARPRP